MTFLVFPDLDAFETFKASFPSTLAVPDTLLGDPAYEFPGDDQTPPSGRLIVAHTFNASECALLQMAGADVRVGGIDGPVFGESEDL